MNKLIDELGAFWATLLALAISIVVLMSLLLTGLVMYWIKI